MKDNRKNLKEGFVYPGTSKEEPKKKHYKGILARKFTSVQKAEGTEPLCSSFVKIYSPVDRIPMRPETELFFPGPQHAQPTKGRGRNINNSSLDLGFSSFFFFFF